MLLFFARTVFHRPVSWVVRNLDGDELLEWQAEYLLDPWGESRADLSMALARATMIELWADTKGQPVDVVGLMPKFDGERPEPKKRTSRQPQDWREQQAHMIAYTRAAGGTLMPGWDEEREVER